MLQFLTSLKDAPVANILALAGILFIVAAAGGHIPRGRQLDRGGRWLCGIVGLLLLAVASWVAVALIPPAEPKKEVVPAPTPQVTATAASRIPSPTWVIEVRKTEPKYVDWGCEETKPVNLSLQLAPNEEFVSGEIVVSGLDKAKSQKTIEPRYDSQTRTVSGGVEFVGFNRVFFNCPGGGHATVQLVAQVRVHPTS